jgi:hypothetical protein
MTKEAQSANDEIVVTVPITHSVIRIYFIIRYSQFVIYKGVCFWEAGGLQNHPAGFDSLHSCYYCRRGSTEKGSGLVNRIMLVRIQSSALNSRGSRAKSQEPDKKLLVIALDSGLSTLDYYALRV